MGNWDINMQSHPNIPSAASIPTYACTWQKPLHTSQYQLMHAHKSTRAYTLTCSRSFTSCAPSYVVLQQVLLLQRAILSSGGCST